MEKDRFLEGIYRALWERLHAERGTIARTEQMLGKCRGSLWMTRNRDGFRLSTLGEILSFLGVSPEWFFRRAFPHPPDPLAHYFEAAQMLQRQHRALPTLTKIRDRFLDGDGGRTTEATEAAEVDRLEQLRVTDSVQAAEQAKALAATTESAATAAQALGVWASAIRTDVQQLDHALLLLEVAFQLARKCGDRAGLARLLLRGCYVLSDRGEPEEGLVLADYALVLSSEHGDEHGVGKAHINRATMLVHSQDNRMAVEAYKAAHRYLPTSDSANVAAALQGLGRCLLALNQATRAASYLQEAEKFIPESDKPSWGRLKWVQARAAGINEDHRTACQFFEEASNSLTNLPIDRALLIAEHCRALLRCGRLQEARDLALSMRTLLFELQPLPIVEAAVGELIRAASEATSLQAQFVNQVVDTIERGRSQKAASGLYK